MEGALRQSLARLVAELRRELAELSPRAAYGWGNRLLALRCMEARGLCDEVIVRRAAYAGRSLEHHRFALRHPERCLDDDDGLFAVLEHTFAARAAELPLLFDPEAPCLAERPSAPRLQRVIALLGTDEQRTGAPALPEHAYRDPALLGWAYQLWNADHKERVFDEVRGRRRKIGGHDLIAATQLYTPPHLVEFLVQNSLGAIWAAMHPDSPLLGRLDYLVPDLDLPSMLPKSVAELRVLDPACGSGHFLLEAFELLYAMYEEEGVLAEPAAIGRSIVEHNLFGIDIDRRALELAEALLWMKVAERCRDLGPVRTNLLRAPPPRRDLPGAGGGEPEPADRRAAGDRARLEPWRQGLAHADELGGLLRLAGQDEPPGPDPADGPLFARGGALRPIDPALQELLAHLEPGRVEPAARLEPAGGERRPPAPRSGELHRLIDLLRLRFDVVAMNPPYAGFRTLAPHLKEYLRQAEPDAGLDLYVAFISRFWRLLRPGGLLAAVTPASWTTSTATTELRRRILREGGPVLMAALGQRVFETAPLLFVALQVLGRGRRAAGGELVALRTTRGGGPDELRHAVAAGGRRWPCGLLRTLPSAPFLPVAPPELLATAGTRPTMGRFFSFVDGIWTGHSDRDVRQRWEVPSDDDRWVRASGGQGYSRWYAATRRRLRAEHAGRWAARVERTVGFEYARVAGGNLCGRSLSPPAASDGVARSEAAVALAGVVSVLPLPTTDPRRISEALAVFNSRIGALWLRTLSSGLNFNPGYAARIPLGAEPPGAELCEGVGQAVELKRRLARFEPSADDFDPVVLRPADEPSLADLLRQRALEQLELQTALLELEQRLEQQLSAHLGLSPSSSLALDEALEPPVAAHPRRPGQDGDGARQGREPRSDGALPTESELEGCCRAHRIHPRTVLELASHRSDDPPSDATDLVTTACELRRSAERRLLEDYLTTLVLELFEQAPVDGDEPVAVRVAGGDGRAAVVLLTVASDRVPASELLRRALRRDFVDQPLRETERVIADRLGRPLERWLVRELFPRHVRVCRRRPIIWQLDSAERRRGRRPALQLWLHGGRIDADTLPKVQSHLVRPLRRLWTARAAGEGDAGELRRWRERLEELDRFDQRLGRVIAAGFDHGTLGAELATEPLDRWSRSTASGPVPADHGVWTATEGQYRPVADDGVRVNLAPLELAGLLARPVLREKDARAAIVDRARWRAELRQRCRSGALTAPPWWPGQGR